MMVLADRSHFQLLYERYANRLYWYAIARTGSEAAADDIVSDTMLTAYENLHRFDAKRGSFAAWVFRIGQRKTLDHQRAHQRIRRLLTRARQQTGPRHEVDTLDHILDQERALEVRRAVATLPGGDREIIALRYAAGFSGKEIADHLGVSHAAARKRLSRALQRLASRLEEQPQ